MLRAGVLVVILLSSLVAFAQGGHGDASAPYIPPPANAANLTDAVSSLTRRMAAKRASLSFDTRLGYLPSVLRNLDIPVSSQVLVFSKTSLQHEQITPRTPRAIYFNDDTYIGFVPDGRLIEMSAVDPAVGAVFYALSQSANSRPRLVTSAECLQCHAIPATLDVPGHLMRSVFTNPDGQMAARLRSYLTDDRSPLEERWGGWYVSGSVAGATHMGNAVLRSDEDDRSFDRSRGTAIHDLKGRFRDDRYLTADSDVVALMVLGHQTRMHNLIARLHHTATQGRPVGPDVEALLRYMLFVDEAPLGGRVTGSTTFAADFTRRGPRDSRNRSLRDFNLETRLFRYPCSYLIYSDAFAGLPTAVKTLVLERLANILGGRDDSGLFGNLASADRQAIAEILDATLPAYRAVALAAR